MKKVSEFRELGYVSFPYLALEGWQRKLSLAADGDETGSLEFFEMVRKSCGGDTGAITKFDARAALLSSDVLQDVVTAGIGERLGDGAKLCAS